MSDKLWTMVWLALAFLLGVAVSNHLNKRIMELAVEARESCLVLASAQDTYIDELRETLGHYRAVAGASRE